MQEFLFALEVFKAPPMEEIKGEIPLFCALFRFQRDCDAEQICMETCGVIQMFKPIRLFSELQDKEFGPNRRTPVHMIRKTAQLQRLHDAVCGVQLARGAIPSDPEWIAEGYRPHVADRGERCIPAGTEYVSRFVTLYEKPEGPGALRVYTNIMLDDKQKSV